MIKFLIQASYSATGAAALLKSDSGTERKKKTELMINELGGKMESFYYISNGDAWVICELPDLASAASIALKIKASGMGSISTTVLLETEEVDKAIKLNAGYRYPGSN